MNYFSFSGVSTRSEYWGTQLISVILMTILFAVFLAMIDGNPAFSLLCMTVVGGAYAWVSAATMARRLRDAGVNVWWTLAYLVPYVGFVVFVVAGCLVTEKKQ